MRNEPWVWPEVRDAGTSGAGAVPLRSAQMMGQQQQKKKSSLNNDKLCKNFIFFFLLLTVLDITVIVDWALKTNYLSFQV